MAITDKKAGVWGLDQAYNKRNQGVWPVPGSVLDNAQTFMWGFNEKGQLGQNNKTDYSSPVQVPGGIWTIKGDVGYQNAMQIKSDGTLWGWGSNSYGKLGFNTAGTPTDTSSPKQVPGTTWANVSVGGEIALVTKTDGTLWTMGRNMYGQLGQNNTVHSSSPTQIPGTNWSITHTSSATYRGNSAQLKTDGTLWVWGRNEYGMLGQNQAPAQLGALSSPTQIPGTTWSKYSVCGGNARSLGCIKTDGTLWMWGRQSYGTLAQNGTHNLNISSPVQVPGTTWKTLACGTYTSIAVKTDGTLWTWGANTNGSLGQSGPANAHRSSPVQVPGTSWDDVSAGQHFVAATRTDGTLWTWGENDGGQLGHNDLTDYSSPRQVPGTDWIQSPRFGMFHLKPGVMGFQSV